jgi:hypothetical protein
MEPLFDAIIKHIPPPRAKAGSVSVIHIANPAWGAFSATVVTNFITGAEPWNIVSSPDGKRIFVANSAQPDSLNGFTGHDTNGVATEDLMASPQFVIDAAYAMLRSERFPLPLPFHQPLEVLRRCFGRFEVPLPPAMERIRKTYSLERGDDFLLVNLPAFKAYLIRDQKNVWETRTQVGKEARQTPTFRADMKYAIFNPTWTVPTTILREDVLGGIAKGKKDVLTKHNLKVYDHDGNVVDPASIDWKSATAENFKYTLRQDAGDDNALGRVKFMFPNAYDVYLHDTPSRDLFSAEKRTFSSGCIRIEDPLGLAQVLLADQGYDAAKVNATIATGKTTQVDLTAPLPVLIVYWTTSVGASGEVHWAPDVYDRDAPVLAALNAPSHR